MQFNSNLAPPYHPYKGKGIIGFSMLASFRPWLSLNSSRLGVVEKYAPTLDARSYSVAFGVGRRQIPFAATMILKLALTMMLLVGTLTCVGHDDPGYSHDSAAKTHHADWMSQLLDSVRLADLSIPGTHDSMSLTGTDVAQCQSMGMAAQLESGVRYFDIRAKREGTELEIYHGITDQNAKVRDVLTVISAFLTSHPNETVLLNISHHGLNIKGQELIPYWNTVNAHLAQYAPGLVWDSTTSASANGEDRFNPRLAEVRGKIILIVGEGDNLDGTDNPPFYPAAEKVPSHFDENELLSPIGFLDKDAGGFGYKVHADQDEWWKIIKGDTGLSAPTANAHRLYKKSIANVGVVDGLLPLVFPYFVASGHSDPRTDAPRLWTGLTTLTSPDAFPDFPRLDCVNVPLLGQQCSIYYEGVNTLVMNGIDSGLWDHVGILACDFPGPGLIDSVVFLNSKYRKHPTSVWIESPKDGEQLQGPDIGFNVGVDAIPGGDMVLAPVDNPAHILASASSFPFYLNWANVAPGTYTVYAYFKNQGFFGKYASQPVTITVLPLPEKPTATITFPANGAVLETPLSLTIRAEAVISADQGNIAEIEFYEGADPLQNSQNPTTFLGRVQQPPFNFTWENVPPGTYTLWVVAYTSKGGFAEATPVNITVKKPNQLPSVTLISPGDGTGLVAPASISLNAIANDADGRVDAVAFFSGGILIGTATNAPYSFNWSNVSPGTYALQALAVDNEGGRTATSPVMVTVIAPMAARQSSLRFDGQDDFVRVVGVGQSLPTDEITVEFWQKASLAKEQVTFSMTPSSTTNLFQSHVPWSDGRVYWDFGNSTAQGRLSYQPPVSIVGTWQHFAMVASRSGNYMKIFRNGIEEASKSGMSPYVPNPSDLLLGAFLGGDNPSAGFAGELDEFRIWNRALSGTEIGRNYYHRLGGRENGLVAYWRLDPVAGPLVWEDVSGVHGTRVNGPQWIESCALANAPGVTLVTPVGITQTAGDSLPGYEIANLINNSGLSRLPTVTDYELAKQGPDGTWATLTAVFPNNYFVLGNVAPQMVLYLGASYFISDMLVWGYAGNNNEAAEFVVELSDDGGATFGARSWVGTTHLLANGVQRLSLGAAALANVVRVTILNNAGGRGFNGIGPGDRVGLGEIKFLGVNPELIAPVSAQLMKGDTLPGYDVSNLVNGSGLSGVPVLENFSTITQGLDGLWVTASQEFPNYFTAGLVPPVIELDLGRLYALTHLVVWGYGGNNNEATDFRLEFSVNGGSDYSRMFEVASTRLLGTGVVSLPLGSTQVADHVRMTIVNNAGGRGFGGIGSGDRVGLGKVRFIGGVSAGPSGDPEITVTRHPDGVLVHYCNGRLETTTDLDGVWSLVDGAVSPFAVELNQSRRFFRVR